MNWVDVLLTISAIVAITNGWKVGIIRGVAGFMGLLGGAWLALQCIPIVFNAVDFGTAARVFSGLGILVVLAMLGQSLGFAAGGAIRTALSWSPIAFFDSLFGSAFRIVSWSIVVWISASMLALLPANALTSEVRGSQIVQQIDGLAPAAADQATSTLRRLLRNSSFPQVFAGIAPQPVNSVDPADPTVVSAPVVAATYSSVVEVVSDAVACDVQMTGTGFVYADGRIMTNAHVVAGADRVFVQRDGAARRYRADVVLFDPRLDIAVLSVRGFAAEPLRFAPEAAVGDEAVVPGFTGGKPLSPTAARVSDVIVARGHDIYGEGRVDREIYVIRAAIAPGDSGAPLIGMDGRVLGVMFAAGTDVPDAGYALTANAVGSAASQGRISTKPVSLGACSS